MSATTGPGVQLQKRDFDFLRGLFESRVMTADHAAAIHFDGKRHYTTKRLQKLKAAGLVSERRRRVNEPAILFLTRKAFALLKTEGRLDGLPSLSPNTFENRANVSDLTLRHELEIMDVKAAMHRALAGSPKFTIQEFSTWPVLHQFEASIGAIGHNLLVKPDGFVRIHEREEGTPGSLYECFLEVDRSSESLETLVQKALCYHEFYHSGGYAIRNGGQRSAPDEFPFRVLVVTKSAERRSNIAERLTQSSPPVMKLVWLATLADVVASPLGPVWIRPLDYHEAVKATSFHRETTGGHSVYRRNPERDAHVAAKVSPLRLLE
jgi:hypothetical protein